MLILLKHQQDLAKEGHSWKIIELINFGAPKSKIKASGGIRTTASSLAYIKKDVSRIETSNGIEILAGLK